MRLPLLENGPLLIDNMISLPSPPLPNGTDISISYTGSGEEMPNLETIANYFNQLADNTITERFSTDGEAAVFIHEKLRLSPFEASHHKFWHYLAVVECPRYVAWRWFSDTINTVPRNRYLGAWYKNALGRLWWWGEFSYAPSITQDRYFHTLKGAQSQEFMRDMIENLLCGNRYLIKTLCDICFPAGSEKLKDTQIRELIKRVNAILVTTVVDSLNEVEITKLVSSLYDALVRQKIGMD